MLREQYAHERYSGHHHRPHEGRPAYPDPDFREPGYSEARGSKDAFLLEKIPEKYRYSSPSLLPLNKASEPHAHHHDAQLAVQLRDPVG